MYFTPFYERERFLLTKSANNSSRMSNYGGTEVSKAPVNGCVIRSHLLSVTPLHDYRLIQDTNKIAYMIVVEACYDGLLNKKCLLAMSALLPVSYEVVQLTLSN